MPFNNSTIEIRPRTHWESMDLGIILARKHYVLLASTWLLITLPCFVILSLIFWNHPFIAIMLFWWLKPLFDRIPLHILANAVFNNTPTCKQTLLFWLKTLKRNVFSNLLWQRLSLSRSFNLPVQQLENSSGSQRRQRLFILHRVSNNARWLTIIFLHFETILYFSLLALFYSLIPSSGFDMEPLHEEIFDANIWFEQLNNWQVHLTNLAYVFILAITEPFYISCGFCLYLNRRIHLEGWDIELAFRRLAKRLTQITTILIIGLLITINPLFSKTLQAETDNDIESINLAPLIGNKTNTQKNISEKKRAEIKTQIEDILKSPPFYEVKEQTHYRWKKDNPDPQAQKNHPSNQQNDQQTPPHQKQSFNNKEPASTAFNQISTILLWSTLILIVCIILYYAVQKMPQMNNAFSKKNKEDIPTILFGLEIAPETLPKNLIDEFESLWGNQPRQALSLLYRALLSHLVDQQELSIKKSNTELEIIELTKKLQQPLLTTFTEYLTHLWLLIAYGHYSPSLNHKEKLKQDWQALHNQEVKVK